MILKLCAVCKTPKAIHFYNRTQWNLKGTYRTCAMCSKKPGSKNPKAGTDYWRATMTAVLHG